MTDLVERLRQRENVPTHDPRVFSTDALAVEAANEIERLRAEVEQQRLELGITEDACGMLESEVKQLRARVAELEAYIDFFDPMTKCARCGVEKRQTSLIPEEGDEWECFECWERENAREKAATMKESSR